MAGGSGLAGGIVYGIAAYGTWGLFPLYFDLLDFASPIEVLAHRVVWSLLFVGIVIVLLRRRAEVRSVLSDRRRLGLLAVAAVLIAGNWGTYIYAVHSDETIEAALGYFVAPLVSVGLGVAFFKERLRGGQWVALGLGAIAVVVLTIAAAGFPWIALVLAATFGSYGLLKKLAGVGAFESLTVETLVLALPAMAFLVILGGSGDGHFPGGAGHALLLILSGPVTAVPLLLYAACVVRTPLSTVGLLQYITPVGQFLIGWLLQDETMQTGRWIGFGLVWIGLVALSVDALRSARTRSLAAPAATA